VTNGGATIDDTQVAALEPSAAGGTIQVGTYFQTAEMFYTGPGGAKGPTGHTVKAAVVVTSSSEGFTFQFVTSKDGSPEDRQTQTALVTGPNLVVTATCGVNPVGFSTVWQYTATSTTLSILYTNAIETYALQP
jgi:hypothetical protein